MVGVARCIGLCNEASEGIAEHHRPLNAEDFAKGADVVRPLIKRPQRWIATFAATVAAMVEIDELRDFCERSEAWLEHRMVEAGAAVQQEQRRLLPQTRSIHRQLFAIHIEEQPYPVDRDVHSYLPESAIESGPGLRQGRAISPPAVSGTPDSTAM